jgi:hypothetical protein
MPTTTSNRTPEPAVLPPAVLDLLQRFVQLAKEIEPYVQDQDGEGVYIDYKQGSWTPAMLVRLRREIYPYPAAVELLQFAAENAGSEVSYRDFLQQSSWTDSQVRSDLGAVSKVARKLFGKKVWPVRTRQGSDGAMQYFMPDGIAEWWMRGGSKDRSTG